MSVRSLIAAGAAGITVFSVQALAGPLDPPAGPIAPTHKPLAEVEPRVAINVTNTPGDANSVFRITQPGSYYLTGNLTGVSGKAGIEIGVGNVTIDLMGFTATGGAGSLDGIWTDAAQNNLVVRNGTVTGWGGDGIDLFQGGTGVAGAIEHVHASDNAGWGFKPLANAIVTSCTATNNTVGGFNAAANATVRDCLARSNGGVGIHVGNTSTVIACTARLNTGIGIEAINACIITQCEAYDNGAVGILCGRVGVVSMCTSHLNDSHGIEVDSYSQVRDNVCVDNGEAGISISGADCRVEGNNSNSNVHGMRTTLAGNFIVRNICSNNSTANWSIAANNYCLVVVGTPAAAINGDAGGTSPGSTNPNANFTY